MFNLFVATLEKKIYDDDVYSVTIPGASGYFEVLKDHASLISSLVPGKLTFTDKNKKKWLFAISGGVAEVSNNKVIVLGDAIESADEIDVERAKTAMKRSLQFIDAEDNASDIARVQKNLKKAKNRLEVAESLKKRK